MVIALSLIAGELSLAFSALSNPHPGNNIVKINNVTKIRSGSIYRSMMTSLIPSPKL